MDSGDEDDDGGKISFCLLLYLLHAHHFMYHRSVNAYFVKYLMLFLFTVEETKVQRG